MKLTSKYYKCALLLITISPWIIGCSGARHEWQPPATMERAQSDFFEPSRYEAPSQIQENLFSDDIDQVDAKLVKMALDGKVTYKDSLRIVFYELASDHYGVDPLQFSFKEEHARAWSSEINSSKRVDWIRPLAPLLLPEDPDLRSLRRAALRMQADILVLYRRQESVLEDHNIIAKDEFRVYSSIDMIAYDTRTGIIPFAQAATTQESAKENSEDLKNWETKQRMKEKASVENIEKLSHMFKSALEEWNYLESIPEVVLHPKAPFQKEPTQNESALKELPQVLSSPSSQEEVSIN